MKTDLPDPHDVIGQKVPGYPGYVIVDRIDSGGNAHVFRAHSADVNFDLACKVIPRMNLVGAEENPPTWRQEIDKANSLPDIVVRFSGVVDPWPCGGVDCVLLVSEYVRGSSLEKHLSENGSDISISFVESFMRIMLSLLNMMDNRGINHGDLHLRNILVQDRNEILGEPSYQFRVIDFGVSRATSAARLKDDYDQVAEMLKSLLKVVDYQVASPRDKYAYNILNDYFLARHLTERDPTRDPLCRNPTALFGRLEQIDYEFQETQLQETHATLTSPFDFLSCEQIGEDHKLLNSLYSGLFLGVKEIERRGNLVITGPRGCGKSTVFKSLSLRHRYSVQDDPPDSVPYFGVYYRCDDLYAAFPRYRIPNEEDAVNLPIHFLASALLEELLDTAQKWLVRYFEDDWRRFERRASRGVWEAIGLNWSRELGFETF